MKISRSGLLITALFAITGSIQAEGTLPNSDDTAIISTEQASKKDFWQDLTEKYPRSEIASFANIINNNPKKIKALILLGGIYLAHLIFNRK